MRTGQGHLGLIRAASALRSLYRGLRRERPGRARHVGQRGHRCDGRRRSDRPSGGPPERSPRADLVRAWDILLGDRGRNGTELARQGEERAGSVPHLFEDRRGTPFVALPPKDGGHGELLVLNQAERLLTEA